MEPYCGGDTQIENKGLGMGPNVILDLVDKANIPIGSEVFLTTSLQVSPF